MPHTMTNRQTVLAAARLALSYRRANQPDNVVLQDFSLQLADGEVVAVLGPSGAGKSSLLRTLAGLDMPARGTVRLKGELVRGPHPRLGFVFQDASLLPWLTLEENVGFGLGFTHQPAIMVAERKARVATAIDEVGLSHAKERYPAELSGGMAQRTALAR